MKKLALILLLLSTCFIILAQEAITIADYFPFRLYKGYYYDRLEPLEDGSIRDSYVECVEVTKKGGEILGVFEKIVYLGSMKIKNVEIYAIGENQVFLAYTKTMLGEKAYPIRPIILKMPLENQKVEWIDKPYDSDEEKYIYTAEFDSTTANNAIFNDCTKVVKEIYVEKGIGESIKLQGLHPYPNDPNFWLVSTEVYYYAHKIGLVKREIYNEAGDLQGIVSKELVKIE